MAVSRNELRLPLAPDSSQVPQLVLDVLFAHFRRLAVIRPTVSVASGDPPRQHAASTSRSTCRGPVGWGSARPVSGRCHEAAGERDVVSRAVASGRAGASSVFLSR